MATVALTYFGLLATLLQVVIALWPRTASHNTTIMATLIIVSTLGGVLHSFPKASVTQDFNPPAFSIKIVQGDILDQQGNIVIGFTDTYDTDLTDGAVINPKSIQGQFQNKYYANNSDALDDDLTHALSTISPVSHENSSAKPRGKLARYEIGTVAALRSENRIFYAAAYGRIENNLKVSCSIDALWKSLTAVWESARIHGSLEPVFIPIIGSELARVGSLGREAIIKMIALSFVSSSREAIVSRELNIVILPKDREHVNIIELRRFLKTL
ncbi:macro domain-containing protein [Streptomyces sp. NPDC102451]|uniref:macro domain-containing protein n=1 Tax=Streptomyces sp. NPDC102451 TaxID=3366177 RepID=UPI0038037275